MTTTHSRSRSTQESHLRPNVRQRAVSSTGSPHSFSSNIAVVAGPTAVSGQYYGVFLGEPPKGFPSSHVSSESASPGRSHSTHHSTGTSNGSVYGSSTHHSETRSRHSSVAFPSSNVSTRQEPGTRSRHTSGVTLSTSVHGSTATPPYHAIRAEGSGSRRASVAPAKVAQPPVMPPSAMKRERRYTLSASSGSSEELPAADLRYLCKFSMGSISECLRRVSEAHATVVLILTFYLSPHMRLFSRAS